MSIFCAKNNLLDLKEHLGNIFFKSAWCYCDKSFFSHNADIFKITKYRNWKKKRSQV